MDKLLLEKTLIPDCSRDVWDFVADEDPVFHGVDGTAAQGVST